MDMFQMLKDDHTRVRGMIMQCLQACQGGGPVDQQALKKIHQELLLHTKLEEEILYPRLRQIEEDVDLIQDSYEDHKQIREIVSGLVQENVNVDTCARDIRRLLDVIDEHVREEETELFPSATQNLSKDEINNLSNRMTQMRQQELQRQPL